MPVLVDLGGNSQQTAFEGEGQQNELGPSSEPPRAPAHQGPQSVVAKGHTCPKEPPPCPFPVAPGAPAGLCNIRRRV